MTEARITVWLVNDADRPNYRLQWLVPGTRKRRSKSARTADPGLAERRRQELEYELNHGLHAEPVRMTWGEFSELYAAEKMADRRPKTGKRWAETSASLVRLAAPRSLAAVDAALVGRYAAGMRRDGLAKATVAGRLAYLRAALRWAARRGLIPAAPAVEMPTLPRTYPVQTVSHEGFLRLLAACPSGGWRLLVHTAWHTGMRRGELLALEWGPEGGRPWVDLRAGRVLIPAAWCKADADSWLPLHPDLLAVLSAAWPGPGPVCDVGVGYHEAGPRFRAIARAAGLSVTMHDLRRSFGTRYAALVPAQVLQRLMRHANISTTMRYYARIDTALEEAIRRA
jgi:integrase